MMLQHKTAVLFIYFAVALLPLHTIDCTKKKGTGALITRIIYTTSGGRSGNYESLDISPDSLRYVQALRGNERSAIQTTGEFWNVLISKINLDDFDRIKSNPGHALYDGIDITIAIETKGGNHTVVNGHEDSTNYKKVQPFTGLLEEKVEILRKSIMH